MSAVPRLAPEASLNLTDDDWDQAFQTNLLGAVRLDRALVPSMIAGQSGVIIYITSVQRRLPMPGTAPYAAAKAALANYSKALSDELAPNGIRVNSVCPGFIETEAAAAFVSEHAEALQISMDAARAEVIKSIGGIPLGRTGDPTDLGDLVAFLASDHARYLTGSRIPHRRRQHPQRLNQWRRNGPTTEIHCRQILSARRDRASEHRRHDGRCAG